MLTPAPNRAAAAHDIHRVNDAQPPPSPSMPQPAHAGHSSIAQHPHFASRSTNTRALGVSSSSNDSIFWWWMWEPTLVEKTATAATAVARTHAARAGMYAVLSIVAAVMVVSTAAIWIFKDTRVFGEDHFRFRCRYAKIFM
ncbi:hypothetical protein B0H13DRAFT_2655967 [Mycena leptocephala]|nr:hypothetical protein B0H13DRAFT_2655967 [Mycena leptocephala]